MLLDLRGNCSFADYFVLCSAESSPQMEAIRDEIDQALSREGVSPLHLEGTADSWWLLMDFGAVVVHIFEPGGREYYGLDRLWSGATPLVRMQ